LSTTRGDIKKTHIREVNNVIVHVFSRRITSYSDETFNNLDCRAYINVFLKPSMVSHSPYHQNRVSNSCQPNKINQGTPCKHYEINNIINRKMRELRKNLFGIIPNLKGDKRAIKENMKKRFFLFPTQRAHKTQRNTSNLNIFVYR